MSGGQPRIHSRLARIALVGAVVIACLGLAYWQWSRFESTAGTAQNLGYALQWPGFAIFAVWAYRRFLTLEADPEAAEPRVANREIPAGLLPERESASALPVDSTMAEYNGYLAELSRVDDSASAQSKEIA